MNPIRICEPSDSEKRAIKQGLRPIGMFRFLAPLDTVVLGDLFRCIPLSDDNHNLFDACWSVVDEDSMVLNEQMHNINHNHHEVIRPIPDESTVVPQYEETI